MEQTVTLAPGTHVLLYGDAICLAENDREESIGTPRMRRSFAIALATSARRDVVDVLVDDATARRGAAGPGDDLSLLPLRAPR